MKLCGFLRLDHEFWMPSTVLTRLQVPSMLGYWKSVSFFEDWFVAQI
jgi:hypothetical protein